MSHMAGGMGASHPNAMHPSRRHSRRRGHSSDDRDPEEGNGVTMRDRQRDRAAGGRLVDADGKQHQVDPLVASSSNVSNASVSSNTSERKHASSHSHHPHAKSNGRPPQASDATAIAAANSPDRDLQSQIADLDKSARKAVASADDVTLALLLTSWANSLAEARHHSQTPALQFEFVFHGSHALDIVANNVLAAHPSPDSPVRKALIALFGFVLYGDHRLHARMSELVVDVNAALPEAEATTSGLREICMRERDAAVAHSIAFLKDVLVNMRAYADVLPPAPDVRDSKAAGRTAASSHAAVVDAAGPAGPDPTKAVERSIDTWRRAVARLQGEMALVVVLNKALVAADSELRPEPNCTLDALDQYFTALRQAVRKHIEADLAARIDRLNAVYWADVAQGAESTVFQAARERASFWVVQFENARRDVERLLDDAGIGFGPSARVPEDKFDVLLGATAGVAALVSCQQRAFGWATETSRLLGEMVTAVRCLEGVADGRLTPSGELRKMFFAGLGAAYAAIDEVVDWSFATLHDKVLGSLEKSCGKVSDMGGGGGGEEMAPRIRALRFEEPPKTPKGDADGLENGSASNRRKPRHARMKSSPDALLHLNARFDEYSDDDTEIDRSVDREIEFNDEEEDIFGAGSIDDSENGEGANASQELTVNGDLDVSRSSEDAVGSDYDDHAEEAGFVADDDEADDRDIIVHDDVEDNAKPKKVSHASHVRSISVDGIPF